MLAFHLGHLRGGYLGVDLFFVLSGFLITSLLLAEWGETGRIDLFEFWARRARRLLPALFVVIGAIAAFAATRPDGVALDALRGDALATLGYVANWHSIVAGHGYWELFAAPSLLAHTWSLAIEEQLYVVWPLLVVAALRFGRRGVLVLAVVLGVASSVAMAVIHGAGDDTTRVYFGTDTRASSVLAGAALAAVVAMRGPLCARRSVAAAGYVAAIGLGVAWFTVPGTADRLYEGGFLLFGLAGVALIAAAMQPGALASVLSFAPLRRLGEISYGVYLWHWPVFVVLTPDRTGVHGWPLLVLELAVTLAISVASYRLIEWPIRRGSLAGWRIRTLAPIAAVVAVAAVVVGMPEPAPSRRTVQVAAPLTPVSAVAPVVGTMRLLVVGDSGAAFLGEGLEHVGPSEHVAVRNAGTIACGLVTTGGGIKLGEGKFLPDPDSCQDWPKRWRDELYAFNPDVSLLLIAWPGLGDRKVGGTWTHPCDPPFDRYYEREVKRAVQVLSTSGSEVVIATSPYLTLPVEQVDAAARVDCLNTIYRRVAKASGAGVLPLGEWVCPKGKPCTLEDGSVTLRPDGIHFEGPGADIAARWVLPELSAQADKQ